jgi:hypothetical protein
VVELAICQEHLLFTVVLALLVPRATTKVEVIVTLALALSLLSLLVVIPVALHVPHISAAQHVPVATSIIQAVKLAIDQEHLLSIVVPALVHAPQATTEVEVIVTIPVAVPVVLVLALALALALAQAQQHPV